MKFSNLLWATSLVVIPLVVSACATLNESECVSVNWTDLGSRDGQAGRPSLYVAEHVEACARHGLPVDEESWRMGWDTGIRVYCTPENGLNVGSRGALYANSCPAELALAFRNAYDVGRDYHHAVTVRNRIQNEITKREDEAQNEQDLDKRNEILSQIIRMQGDLYTAERRVTEAQYVMQRYRSHRK